MNMTKENILSEKEISPEIIKYNIKKQMFKRNIGVSALSKKTNVNIFTLVILLYTLFLTLRLNQTLKICKVLRIGLSTIIYRHPIWHP